MISARRARSHYADWQYDIYEAGLAGSPPPWPVDEPSLQAMAKAALDPTAWAYVAGNAGAGSTTAANFEAFSRQQLIPRVLRAPFPRDHSTKLFGTTFPAPILLAPIGVMKLIHDEGEVGAARAAAQLGLGFIHSTASTTPMEDVAAEVPDNPRWYQMYIPRDEKLAASFLQRAKSSGYQAIVVTLDTTTRAWRPLDLNLGHLPFLHGHGIANYLADPVFRAMLDAPPEADLRGAVKHWRAVAADPTITWESISWVRARTKLPLLLKGILHPDDAHKAISIGVDGLVVSNHGGRQLDGAIAALDALPLITDAARGRVPILFDSGIRTGSDAVKALALGAQAVLLGRPWVWGMAVGGEAGALHALRCFLADYDVALGLTGHRRPSELSPSDLAP